MIDTNELRKLAKAATPGPWKVGQYLGSPRQFVIHMDVGDKGRGSDVAFTSAAFGNDETIANARLIAAANPAAITELLDRLEAAEKGRDALCAKVEEAESSAAWHQRRWMALQMYQTKMREPERTMVCDIIANGELLHPTVAGDRYAIPGAKGE